VLVCRSLERFSYLAIVLVFSAAQSGRSSRRAMGSNEDAESECGRLVGTVRRHMPIDTRDPIGAIIHFYLGDSFDSNRYAKFCNI
jgi:senataxin